MALLLVLAMVLAACGSDDKNDEKSSGETTAAGGEGTGGSFSLDSPMKFVLLAEKKGESPAAVPSFFEGSSLAVEVLNAKGGVGGKPIEFKQITTPLDPAKAENALLQGLDEKPTAIAGFPASAQVVPLAQKLATSGVPTILFSTAGEAFKKSGQSENWAFTIRPRNAGVADIEANYVVNELGAKKVGLICVNNPFGTTGCDAAQKVLKDKGITIVNRRTNEANATDLTEQVLAMKGADVVMDFNFPNPLGVVANQLIENGIKAKHVDGASAGIAAASGAVKGGAATNLYGVDDCVPVSDTRPAAKEFVSKFKTKYGYTPNYAAAEAYDSVMLFAAAVEKAKSTDPAKVADAVRSMTYEGICDPAYKSDSEQVLTHQSYFVKFDATGAPTADKRFDLPDPNAKGGSSSSTTKP